MTKISEVSAYLTKFIAKTSFLFKRFAMKKGKKCSQAIQLTSCDSELFNVLPQYTFWLFLALQNVGNFKNGSPLFGCKNSCDVT